MTIRHNFIRSSALAMAGLFMLAMGCTSKQKNQEATSDAPADEKVAVSNNNSGIGVQIYSVRTELKKDFAGTMKKVGAMGYDYVEGYGMDLEGNIFGMAPEEYRKVVEDSGMKLISVHAGYFTPEQAPLIIEAAKAAGLKYVIIPHLSKELRGDYHKVAENLNKVGALFKGTGIKFGYHNHAFEFEKQGDAIPMEILLEETDPELVTFELDLYWVVKAGHDPMTLINKYPGRFSLYHVKDANENLDQTTLGTGIIDFQALLDAKEKAGLEYYFVEDERTDDPLGNLEADFGYVSGLWLFHAEDAELIARWERGGISAQFKTKLPIKENDIVTEILAKAYPLHTELGPGLLESVYERALFFDLAEAGLNVQSQVSVPMVYKAVKFDAGFRLDLLVEDKVIVEIKSVEALAPVHFAQTLTYLKLSNRKLGLLINFNVKRLKEGVHRVVNGL